jgi:hypothetical protein
MKPVFIYTATITPTDGRDPICLTVGWRGVDQARVALADRFRVTPTEIKLKTERDDAGRPREILVETPRDEQGEQCYASNNARTARCPNTARPGFHTCKIHTSYDAPFAFGTPEYDEWIETEPLDGDLKPATRKTRTRTRKTAAKPRRARSAPRDEA